MCHLLVSYGSHSFQHFSHIQGRRQEVAGATKKVASLKSFFLSYLLQKFLLIFYWPSMSCKFLLPSLNKEHSRNMSLAFPLSVMENWLGRRSSVVLGTSRSFYHSGLCGVNDTWVGSQTMMKKTFIELSIQHPFSENCPFPAQSVSCQNHTACFSSLGIY